MSLDNAYLDFKYRPFKFYLITMLVTLAALLAAAYFSYNEGYTFYKYLFIFVAVLSPCTVAMFMIYGSGNDDLKNDFKNRLLNLKLIKPGNLPFILLTMPVAVVLATAISLLFGQKVGQFAVSPGFSVMGWSAIVTLIVVILAPTFEELGWRGYGVDSLAKKGRGIFASTMVFAVIWDVWHLPLFLVNGYYHYEILQAGGIYALNFVVSIFPVAFLHNWMYYRNNRSIPAVILFHAVNNLSSAALQTEQVTKCIVTAILIVVSAIVLIKDKSLWLEKAENAH
jgi:membrane protease YdiL (CAAX protease family)